MEGGFQLTAEVAGIAERLLGCRDGDAWQEMI